MVGFFLAEGVTRLQGYRPYRHIGSGITSVEPGGRLYRKHPTLGYANLPGKLTITLKTGLKFQVNNGNDGLRITRPPGTALASVDPKQMWIFGGSFTYGFCLNDAETYPWLLQERFPNFEVVNFGVGGYGTLQSLIQLQEALAGGRTPPALLIVAYAVFHNMRNCCHRIYWKNLIPSMDLEEIYLPRASVDQNGKLICKYVKLEYTPFPFMDRFALLNRLETAYNVWEDRLPEGLQTAKAIFREINRICRHRQIVPVVASLTPDKITRKVLEYCRGLGMFTTDISVDITRPENICYPYDNHPNAKTNREYARRLGDFLQGKVLPHLAQTTGK